MTDEDSRRLLAGETKWRCTKNEHQEREIMETRKSLLLSAGVVAIVALLAATNAFAQLSCNSVGNSEGAGSFTVTVKTAHQNGHTIYTYAITRAIPSAIFLYVKKGLNTEGFSPTNGGVYVTPHQSAGQAGFPPFDAWRVVHHQDGVVFPSVTTFTLNVPERFKPEEGLTTILLGQKNSFEHCGPILGPTTPAAPTFQGSPLVSTVSRQTFENGCVYDVTAGETDNIITSITAVTAFGTNPPTEACTVTNTPNICASDLNLPFCPPGELGRPPLQSLPGGTCYYPPNLKFAC
jgi:hypothetical protein